MTNDLLRARREAMTSPSGSGEPMSRSELAIEVNEYIRAVTGRPGALRREEVWRWESGLVRRPGKLYREALRAVLGVESDMDLGFVRTTHGSELTVQALIRHDDRLLMVRDPGTGGLTLPGGRVSDSVPVQVSLQRHVAHQTGLEATVVGFAGGVQQHRAGANDVRHAISLVFEARVSQTPVASARTTDGEERQDAQWVAVEDLPRHDVRPVALRDVLIAGADGPFWSDWTP